MNLELGGLVEDLEKVTQPVYGPQNYVEWFRHVNRKQVKHKCFHASEFQDCKIVSYAQDVSSAWFTVEMGFGEGDQ